MRLTKYQKDMLRAFGRHTHSIAFIPWEAEPLVRAKYLRHVMKFRDEFYYGITRLGRKAIAVK